MAVNTARLFAVPGLEVLARTWSLMFAKTWPVALLSSWMEPIASVVG